MMMPARTLPEAEDELGVAAAYDEDRRPGLGVEFIMAVDDAVAELSERPLAYPRWRQDRPYRKYALRRFPYTVFYVATPGGDRVQIVAIAHNKRRPGYWLSRVVDEQ